MMEFKDSEDYLYSLPRLGLEHGLKNIGALLESMGNPHHGMKCVQVAGTNGKGSTSAMIAAILSGNGIKTGLYTSPHLDRITQRIMVDGKEITEQELARHVDSISRIAHSCTFFEAMTAIAFQHFKEQKVGYAVLEAGLGGRLDATTICEPSVTVITNIDYDHMHILGDTLEKIAYEKAGIIRSGAPLITAEEKPGPLSVIGRACAERGARLVKAVPYDGPLAMQGKFQRLNAGCAIAAAKELGISGFSALSRATIPGRLERAGNVIYDVGHNPACMRAIAEELRHEKRRLIIVFGAKDDKEASEMVLHLPKHEHLILTRFKVAPGGLDPRKIHAKGEIVDDVPNALLRAKSLAGKDGLVLVTGSTFTVSEARGAQRQIAS